MMSYMQVYRVQRLNLKHEQLLSEPALTSVPSESAVPSVLRVYQLYQAFGEIFRIEGSKKHFSL